jgi:hypothetical protein
MKYKYNQRILWCMKIHVSISVHIQSPSHPPSLSRHSLFACTSMQVHARTSARARARTHTHTHTLTHSHSHSHTHTHTHKHTHTKLILLQIVPKTLILTAGHISFNVNFVFCLSASITEPHFYHWMWQATLVHYSLEVSLVHICTTGRIELFWHVVWTGTFSHCIQEYFRSTVIPWEVLCCGQVSVGTVSIRITG